MTFPVCGLNMKIVSVASLEVTLIPCSNRPTYLLSSSVKEQSCLSSDIRGSLISPICECSKWAVVLEGFWPSSYALGHLPANLYGVDLLGNKLLDAHHILPGSSFVNADGQSLPFPSGSFDIVMQYTAISSILDPVLRFPHLHRYVARASNPAG